MEGKMNENMTGIKENGESKIPKPAKLSTDNETDSKENKPAESSKATKTKAIKTSLEPNQTKATNLPKNVKRMSVVKISKDIMNQFQDENMKTDYVTEFPAGIKVLDKENTIKRAPLKDKFSQVSQKQSRGLSKNPSAPDLKSCVAFGGIRFISKKNACRKFDMFKKIAEEPKDGRAVNPPVPGTKVVKRTASETAIAGKEIKWSKAGNVPGPQTSTAKSAKTSLTVKETTLKKWSAFGGMRFTPKWQSTPLKPNLFENIQKVSKNDKELFHLDASAKRLEKIPNSAKVIAKEIETITIDETITLDETIQPSSKEPKICKPASIAFKEISDKVYPAFAGIRLTPKRKSTRAKPDIFKSVQEVSKPEGQERHPPGTSSEKMEKSSGTTKSILKKEIRHSHVKVLEKTSTLKQQCSETVSTTVKETKQVSAFGGIRFVPKRKGTSTKHKVFENIKKESETECLESNPTDSSAKELQAISASSIQKIKVETQLSDDETLEAPSIRKPESSKNEASKNEASKNVKKVVPPAFGGLRFKPKPKNVHDVFGARKSKVDNQMQS